MAQDCFSPTLAAFRFCTNGVTATVKGCYLDENGLRTGDLFTGSVDGTALVGFSDIATIPTNAVGAVVDIDTDIQVDTVDAAGNESDLADVKAMAPTVAAGKSIVFGRVR